MICRPIGDKILFLFNKHYVNLDKKLADTLIAMAELAEELS